MQRRILTLPLEQAVQPEPVSINNLPVPLTPLIGREQQVRDVCALLLRPEVRLLTLIGPGGVGKTRLSVQVATELMDVFADGVCFVPLAAISDPDLVVPTIAQALGLGETGNRPLLERLKRHLREQQLLLLLDNFEQVVRAAPLVVELLTACPDLKVLVTSRTVLRVRGEHEFPVPPLALPDQKRLPDIESLSQYAAVALFVQRARAHKPDFQMTSANAQAIAEICTRLDGLPLAIELAATRIKLLSPQALLARLGSRLQMLTGGAQDMPERQQTLRNTIKWSYDQLSVDEQRLFRRLSVFVGGCTLEAVEAVSIAVGDGAEKVLEGVASLIDKNLLQQVEQANGESRLVLLETIREYGLECLTACGEEEITRPAHAHYYVTLVEETKQEFSGPGQILWLERMDREHDNIRAALRWLVEREEVEMALRLGSALWRFWFVRGYLSEGRQWLERALAASSGVRASVRAKALNAAGMLAYYQGDYARAMNFCQESLVLCRKEGNKRGIAASMRGLAFVALGGGDYKTACAMYEESLAILRELGDKSNIAKTLYYLAAAVSFRGHPGDQEIAHSMLGESLQMFRELEDRRSMAFTLNTLGFVSILQGRVVEARPLLEESLTIHKALNDRLGVGYSLLSLGWCSLSEGDYLAARVRYSESLPILIDLGDRWFIAAGLEGLAIASAAQVTAGGGSLAYVIWATKLWGTAQTLRETIGAPMRSFERAINEWGRASARTYLGEEAFAAAWAEGRMMTSQEVLLADPGALDNPNVAQQQATLREQFSTAPSPTTTDVPSPVSPAVLTGREVEVLRLVAKGLTNAQIAEQLVISLLTVKAHVRSIYSKLRVTTRSAATRYAIEHNLI